MKLSELTRKDEIGIVHVDGQLLDGHDADLSDPRYDSRQVTSGSTFFAIKGFTTDGHQFIAKAIEQGARTIVLSDPDRFSHADAVQAGVARIVVNDARLALAHISEEYFGFPSSKLRLIGVTGTNGKTTTTHVLKQIFDRLGTSVGLLGTIGNWIGKEYLPSTHTTPESRDLSELLATMVSKGATTCLMEVSSHSVVLSRVAALDFDIGVFTNLTQDHLDFHGSMEAYFLAKQEFFNRLKDTAVAITNADSPYGERMVARTNATAHSYGIKQSGDAFGHADLVASEVDLDLHGSRFVVQKRYSDEKATFATGLIGQFNVENLMAAIAALYFGVEGCGLQRLADVIPFVEGVRGRFEAVSLPDAPSVIIDYAHTPDALEHVLRTIRSLMEQSGQNGRLFCVFGCGGDRDTGKRPIMGQVAERYADRIVVTNDNPRSERPERIASDILQGFSNPTRHQVILDRREAIRHALSEASSQDVVLIAGKGHETYQIIGSERYHFDDREEVQMWHSRSATV